MKTKLIMTPLCPYLGFSKKEPRNL